MSHHVSQHIGLVGRQLQGDDVGGRGLGMGLGRGGATRRMRKGERKRGELERSRESNSSPSSSYSHPVRNLGVGENDIRGALCGNNMYREGGENENL